MNIAVDNRYAAQFIIEKSKKGAQCQVVRCSHASSMKPARCLGTSLVSLCPTPVIKFGSISL